MIGARLLLAVFLTLPAACVGDGDIGGEGGGSADAPGLLFASTVTGKVLIIDAASQARIGKVGDGHSVTHGVGVLPGQRALYYGNQTTDSLDRIHLSEDATSGEVVRSLEVPARFKRVVASRGGTVVGVGGEASRAPWVDTSFFYRVTDEGESLIGEVAVTIAAAQGDDGWAPRGISPRSGVAITADGETGWVSHDNNHTITRFDLDPFEEIETRVIEPPADADERWLGPSAHLTLSPDDTWLAVPEHEAGRVTLVRVDNPEERRAWSLPPGQIAEQVAFERDGERMWVLGREGIAILGDENHNTSIPSHLHVVEVAGLTLVRTEEWRAAMTRIVLPPTGDRLWAAGSFHTLVGFAIAGVGVPTETTLASGVQPLLGMDH